jgi:two-component system cell cycle sensor histidine kinase/response regulator CckA
MRRKELIFAGAAVCTLAVQAFTLFALQSHKLVVNISNFSQACAAAIAVGACLWRAGQRDERFAKSFWRHLAVAFSIWTFAQLIYSTRETDFTTTFHGPNVTLPIFFFSFTPFVVLLTKRYHDGEKMDWLRILDSLQIVLLLLATFLWAFYIPYQYETEAQFTARLLDHVFMFRNVTLWIALSLRAITASEKVERHLFTIAYVFMTLYVMATQFPTFGRLNWSVAAGGWMDVCWTIPFTTVTLMAILWPSPIERAAKVSRFRAAISSHLTPSLLPIVVLAVSGYMARRHPEIALAFVITSFACYSCRLAITQFHQEGAKRALAEAESRFRTLFHQNSLPMLVFDRQTGSLLEVNQAAVERYGYSREEFLARRTCDIAEASGVEQIVERTLSASGTSVREERHRTKRGELFDVAVSSCAIEFGGQDAELVTVQDISENKRLEQQLRQSQKMEAVGTLAGGIAHDFNNLLTIITGYSQVILERAGHDEQLRREMQQIEVAANKATALIRQLLAFSRRQLLQPQVINLEQVVSGVEKMLRRLIGENIELVVRTTGTLGMVKADPGQMEQVLINLAINARDAMESKNGGRLTFELQNVELDTEFAREHVGAIPGSYVMLAVADTGCGMSAETQARIFEPFFTTKGSAGSGLGLATVYGIVQQSGGYVTVNSVEGRGTTFRIFLPRTTDAVVPTEGAPETRSENTGSETVLLVEDDDGLRALTRRVLLKHGYQVLESARTSEAEHVCREHPGKIHMLLTDVVMPGLSGKELASRLMMLRPEMVVLYMSGYTDSVVMKQGVEEGSVNFIQKPFTPVALSRKVREVLDAAFGRPSGQERPYLRG